MVIFDFICSKKRHSKHGIGISTGVYSYLGLMPNPCILSCDVDYAWPCSMFGKPHAGNKTIHKSTTAITALLLENRFHKYYQHLRIYLGNQNMFKFLTAFFEILAFAETYCRLSVNWNKMNSPNKSTGFGRNNKGLDDWRNILLRQG